MKKSLISQSATKHFMHHREHKRLREICDLIIPGDNVLDIGCGTGAYVSYPLSYLPINITGIDDDVKSIEYASKKNNHPNLNYINTSIGSFKTDKLYDLVICNHLLEHFRSPIGLLTYAKELLKDSGKLYIGIPNGFGIFELQNLIPRALSKSGTGKRFMNKMMNGRVRDSLNDNSWHIHFFTISDIKRLLEITGWRIEKQVNIEFLGGVIIDRILKRLPKLARWNVNIADKLPPQLVSEWSFVCRKPL